jgi:hypothetical protein
MRAILLLSAVLAGTASRAAASEASPAPGGAGVAPGPSVADDPCRGIEGLRDDPACEGDRLCYPSARARIACELRDAMEARYVFFHRKGELLAAPGRPAFVARRHLDGCVLAELRIDREEDPLRFYDRMRLCTAAFEDGHLLLKVPRQLPAVSLGIRLRITGDGKVLVAHQDAPLARWLEDYARGGEPGLAVGDEVLEVDGQRVSDLIAELGRHVPASSDGARRERAVDALTRRDFLYPGRRTATLTISSGGAPRDLELPWWIGPGAEEHPAVRDLVHRTGITTTDLVDWRPEARGAWTREDGSTDGLLRGDPILPPSEAARLEVHRGDANQLAARLGEGTTRGGRPFCYAQLLSFHTEDLSREGARRPFPEVLQAFLAACNARGLDLVLDLRQNEGGYLSHSTRLARMLTPRAGTSPGGALVLRATPQNEQVYRERAPMLGGVPTKGVRARSEPEKILEAIRAARRTGSEYTPAFLDPPLRASDAIGGYDGRVVALVSPGCMSACDRLAAMLRGAGRAVLVGGPTEGAGASQQETRDQSARWTDRGGRLSVSIPNAAMGVQRSATPRGPTESAELFFGELAFENRPVPPSVPYATSRLDLTAHNRGWLLQAEAALQP